LTAPVSAPGVLDVFLVSGDEEAMFARYSMDVTGIEATVRKMLEERRSR